MFWQAFAQVEIGPHLVMQSEVRPKIIEIFSWARPLLKNNWDFFLENRPERIAEARHISVGRWLSLSLSAMADIARPLLFVCGQNTVELGRRVQELARTQDYQIVRSFPNFNRPQDGPSTEIWTQLPCTDLNARPDAAENVQLAGFAERVLNFPIQWHTVDPVVARETAERLANVEATLQAEHLLPEFQPVLDSLRLLREYAIAGDDRLWKLFVNDRPNRDMEGLYGSFSAVQHLDLTRLRSVLYRMVPKGPGMMVTTAHNWRWFTKLIPAAPGERIPAGCFTDLRNLVEFSGLTVPEWIRRYPNVPLPDAVAADMEHDDLLVIRAVHQAKPDASEFLFQFPTDFDGDWCYTLAQSTGVPYSLFFDADSKNQKALTAVRAALPEGFL